METTLTNLLDVTQLEPRMKHPTIFERFDLLKDGETLTILNDHDPKPLYYQMLGERGNIFTWQYKQEGPEWWKVDITKRLNAGKEETLGEIAAKDLHKAQVFKKLGLDFCCGGKKTLRQVCQEKGLDYLQVEKELQVYSSGPVAARPLPYHEWGLDFLADYIVNTHHAYLYKILPDLLAWSDKVARVHSSRHPELVRVAQLIVTLNSELTSHMLKEERVLFPLVKQLVQEGKTKDSGFSSVMEPVSRMEMEHEAVGAMLSELRSITQDYTLPEDACATYNLLFRSLEAFEEDLILHIHLENNIMFSRAAELEKTIR